MNIFKRLWLRIKRFFRKEIFDMDLLTMEYVKSLNRPDCKILITFMSIALKEKASVPSNVELLDKYPNATYVAVCNADEKILDSFYAKDVEDSLFAVLSDSKGSIVIECDSKDGNI